MFSKLKHYELCAEKVNISDLQKKEREKQRKPGLFESFSLLSG